VGKFSCQINSAEDFSLRLPLKGFSILRQNFFNTQEFSSNDSRAPINDSLHKAAVFSLL
jgi:hypothetical protein